MSRLAPWTLALGLAFSPEPDASVDRAALSRRAAELKANLQTHLERLPRSTPWHAVHWLLVAPRDSEAISQLAARVSPPDAERSRPVILERLGDDLEPHPGQYLLALLRQLGPRGSIQVENRSVELSTLVEAALAEQPWRRRAQEASIEIPTDLARLRIAKRALSLGSWRRDPEVSAWRERASRLDLSWFLEALAIDRLGRGVPIRAPFRDRDGRRVTPRRLFASQWALYQLDRRTHESTFVPELGVHMLAARCRTAQAFQLQGDRTAARSLEPAVAAMFEDLIFRRPLKASGDWEHSLRGHLLELLFESRCRKPPALAAEIARFEVGKPSQLGPRIEAWLSEMENYAQSQEGQGDFGFLSHSVRGLHLVAERSPLLMRQSAAGGT